MTEMRLNTGAILLALISVAVIFFNYHDQFWWPVDEGVYAYVAQRANAGDIIHRDIIDLHGGYGNLLNALAFRVFGEDLLSLRYPLVAISFAQCIIAFVLLKEHGRAVALVGAITVAAFSFVQFPNPSANWHALGAFFCLCLCLEKMPRRSSARLFLAGVILGLCFFTRQLSGVFLGLGLICVLLAEAPGGKAGSRVPTFLIGGISLLGLLAYLISKQHFFGAIWGGVWPLGLLLIITIRTRMHWSFAGRTSALVTAGFILAGLPLAILALSQGAFSFWISDILFTALLINGQAFVAQASFLTLLQMAWQNIFGATGVVPLLSGTAWIFLVLSVPALGAYVFVQQHTGKLIRPTTVLAVFWAIGALHYQIPIYLFFALPAVLLALLLVRPSPPVLVTMIVVSGWALVFQAGQPLERGLAGVVAGHRTESNTRANLPRISLRVQAEDAATFSQVINAIERTALPAEPLMTLPMDPELNFMTGRTSPVRYYGTPLGLRQEGDVDDTLVALDAVAPLFVVHRRQDKYLTALSERLLEQVRARSDAPVSIGPFDLYRYRGASRAKASAAGR